jgi:hypothetical protein
MGKSYTREAHDIFNDWREVCLASTGTSNSYEVDGNKYFMELSRKQHEDCRITGTVWRLVARNDETGVSNCTSAGSFRISADGKTVRYPVGLRKLISK